jgi:hypothetical protein
VRYNPGTHSLLIFIFLGFGLMCALAAGVIRVANAMAMADAYRTTGIVTAFEASKPAHAQKGPPPQPTVAPVIAFTPPGGTEGRFTSG